MASQTSFQNCQGDLEGGKKKLRRERIGFHRHGHAIGFQLAPRRQEFARARMRGLHISFHLAYYILQRTGHELPKNLPVTIRQRFAGYFLAEAGRETVMIVEAGVVVPHRGEIDKPIKRLRKRRKGAVAQIFSGLLNVESSG
jgi:hypothetical protein